jgi:hypothetical protein
LLVDGRIRIRIRVQIPYTNYDGSGSGRPKMEIIQIIGYNEEEKRAKLAIREI